jgi:glutamate dehydrogenase/leucine dehydrogenase
VAIVPDVMANGGGVISSYYEWAENHQRVSWSEADERRLVLERVDRSWEALAAQEPQYWRDHALKTAINRVTDAMALAGHVSVQHHERRAAPDARAGR